MEGGGWRDSVCDGHVVAHALDVPVERGVRAERGPRERERPAVVRPEGGDDGDDHDEEEDGVHGRKSALTVIPPRVAERSLFDKILPSVPCWSDVAHRRRPGPGARRHVRGWRPL